MSTAKSAQALIEVEKVIQSVLTPSLSIWMYTLRPSSQYPRCIYVANIEFQDITFRSSILSKYPQPLFL